MVFITASVCLGRLLIGVNLGMSVHTNWVSKASQYNITEALYWNIW